MTSHLMVAGLLSLGLLLAGCDTAAPPGAVQKGAETETPEKKVADLTGRRPRFYFRLHPDQNIDTPRCVHFLRQLATNLKGKLFVLWDRLGAHQSRGIRKFVKRAIRLRLFYFPPYAPDLNEAFCQMRSQTRLLHSFLHHSPLSFFDEIRKSGCEKTILRQA